MTFFRASAMSRIAAIAARSLFLGTGSRLAVDGVTVRHHALAIIIVSFPHPAFSVNPGGLNGGFI
jgi:hypothetical protein